jgi:hypothetical protein
MQHQLCATDAFFSGSVVGPSGSGAKEALFQRRQRPAFDSHWRNRNTEIEAAGVTSGRLTSSALLLRQYSYFCSRSKASN